MKTEVEKLPESKVKIKFQVPAEMVDQYIDKAYKDLSKDITLPGFRPGKAPKHLIEEKVGSEAIHNKALELLFPFAYAEAITQEKIIAVGRPEVRVTKFAPGNPADLEAEVSVLPEVELGNYKKLVVEKKSTEVDEKDIEKVIENIRKREAVLKPKEGKAENGDWVEVDFSGEKNGIKMEKLGSKNHPFIIGDGTLLSDFEKQVVGMTEGEQKTFDLTFPRDYNDKEMAGEKVQFTLKLNKIQRLEAPELNQEFVNKVTGGQDKTIEDFKKDVKEALKSQKEQEERIRQEEEIITQVTNKAKLELPRDLVNDEKEQTKEAFVKRLESQGLNLERYLEFSKKTMDDFDEELRKEAEKKIKVGLILNKIAEVENIEISEEERENEVKKVKEKSYQENTGDFNEDEARRYVTVILKHRKAIDKLFEYADK